jgi:hypothetical protein
MSKKYIIIDEDVARYMIHHANHLDWDSVLPQQLQGIKLKLATGREMTLGEIIKSAKTHVEQVTNYLKIALAEQKEKKEE